MNIVILDGYTENPGDLSWDGFERLGSLAVYPRIPGNGTVSVAGAIADAEIVITNKTPITAETIKACPGIKYIGLLSTGYNVVDLDAARARGIPVTNIPAYGTDAVSQFVFALLLEICHHVAHHDKAVKDGAWAACPDFCFWDFPLIELSGKTMGIVGFGRIGRATCRIAKAFGMHVVVNDPLPGDADDALAEYASLDDLYSRSDVIVLHCPLTPGTEGMIGKDAIAKMKDGVIIINNARGPLIVEQDLADALNAGKVYAAGVDVVSVEPIRPDNPLLTAKNCFITPHISWAPKESRQRLMDIAVENLSSFLSGKPVNVVNP
ncbi:MAG: D-2-hydroxyacid dehydrogenase [Clostridiales bacterium]|nr:D-2-hydroxyacid dehydrogenase [Clostridiales bacterium]